MAAQENDPTRNLEAIIESIVENLEEETDATVIVEDLERLAESPLNMNTASASDFSRLHTLDDIQIQKLIGYRKKYGPVYSIYELNTIDGFTPGLLAKMEPFIWFGPEEKEPQQLSETLKYGRHQLLLRGLATIQKPRGYNPKEDGTIPYEGERGRYYARYRFQSGDRFQPELRLRKIPAKRSFRVPIKMDSISTPHTSA